MSAAALVLICWLGGSAALTAEPPAGRAPASPGAAAPAGAAPASGAPVGPPLVEAIEVEVVNVDVVALDRSGKHVDGLRREDFEVFEDGKRVPLANFLAPAGTAEEKAALAEDDPGDGAAAPQTAAAPAPDPRQRLYLVVYVDNDNLLPFGRNNILRQMRAWVGQALAPGDRVAVFTHQGSVRPEYGYNEPPDGVDRVLEEMTGQEARTGILLADSTFQAKADIANYPSCMPIFMDEMLGIARRNAQAVLANVKQSLEALETTLQSLGQLEGRKALLYVSNGLPLRVGEEVFWALDEKCNTDYAKDSTIDTSSMLRRMTRAANLNRVTLYSLEASGLRNYSSSSAEAGTLARTPGVRELHETMIWASAQDSLSNMASETGGRAALNGSDFTADLAQIAGDFRHAYSLGFTPARAGDRSGSHAIRVEVKRKGVRLHYRTSYFAFSLNDRLKARVQGALFHGGVRNQLGAGLELGTSTVPERGRLVVPFSIRIDLRRIVLVPQGDLHEGRLSILIASRDGYGNSPPLRRETVAVRIPAAELQAALAKGYVYDFKLSLPVGRQRVAVEVYDEIGHGWSTLIEDLGVAADKVTDFGTG
ncbi:MAG TPA: VWA domain-containing protein [Thermoanaerobaculia bacterium]|nr:VWA domain-containing protein [Thermoanaerobaculia bacterium]